MIINKGKIVADGTPEQLRKKAAGREMLKVTVEDGSQENIYHALKNLPTVEQVDITEGTENKFEVHSKPGVTSTRVIFTMCRDNGWILTELTPVETKLEDIFRELTLN
ncbi:MAG: DUF4162 domain-containing protein [Bacteroidetes bacterium]|nr:DUF4162 domain-containing protein [Bacteroidota bacterium]